MAISNLITGKIEPVTLLGTLVGVTAITSGGLLAVSESETATTFTVIAKSKVDGSKVGICEITVTE